MHIPLILFSLCTAALGVPATSAQNKALAARAVSASDVVAAFLGPERISAQLSTIQESADNLNVLTAALSAAGRLEEIVDGLEMVTTDISEFFRDIQSSGEFSSADADIISAAVAQFSVVNSRLFNTLIRRSGISAIVPIGTTNLRRVFQAYSDALLPVLYRLQLLLPSRQRVELNTRAVTIEQLLGTAIEAYGGILEDL